MIAVEQAKMDAANKKYEMDTNTKIEKIKGRTMIAEEQTKYQVANITARIDILQAKNKYNVTKISQDAALLKSKKFRRGFSKNNFESAAYKDVINDFQTNGLHADNIVSYEFSDLVKSIDPSKLKWTCRSLKSFICCQKVSQENLEGQAWRFGLIFRFDMF